MSDINENRVKLEYQREFLKETIERLQLQLMKCESELRLYTETPLGKIGLSIRARQCLARGGIHTVERLMMFFESGDPLSLYRINNLGNGTMNEIVTGLKTHGFLPADYPLFKPIN